MILTETGDLSSGEIREQAGNFGFKYQKPGAEDQADMTHREYQIENLHCFMVLS